jgi:hypothetical protein
LHFLIFLISFIFWLSDLSISCAILSVYRKFHLQTSFEYSQLIWLWFRPESHVQPTSVSGAGPRPDLPIKGNKPNMFEFWGRPRPGGFAHPNAR